MPSRLSELSLMFRAWRRGGVAVLDGMEWWWNGWMCSTPSFHWRLEKGHSLPMPEKGMTAKRMMREVVLKLHQKYRRWMIIPPLSCAGSHFPPSLLSWVQSSYARSLLSFLSRLPMDWDEVLTKKHFGREESCLWQETCSFQPHQSPFSSLACECLSYKTLSPYLFPCSSDNESSLTQRRGDVLRS